MKYFIALSACITAILIAVLAARAVTMAQLQDPNAIFNDFEQTESLWFYSDKIGAATASGVERAKVAIGGPLGLSAQEAVYFIATVDSENQPLRSACTYKVSGTPIDTRWWSISLYDTVTQHYVANRLNRASWNSVAIPRDAQGAWSFTVSASQVDGAWLPSQADSDRQFELNMRVYNPSDALRAKIPNINLPRVERVAC